MCPFHCVLTTESISCFKYINLYFFMSFYLCSSVKSLRWRKYSICFSLGICNTDKQRTFNKYLLFVGRTLLSRWSCVAPNSSSLFAGSISWPRWNGSWQRRSSTPSSSTFLWVKPHWLKLLHFCEILIGFQIPVAFSCVLEEFPLCFLPPEFL